VAISPHLRTGVLTRDPSAFEPVVRVAAESWQAPARTRGTHKLCGVADSRERRQLRLIHEFASLAGEAGVEWRLRGGWALDFFLGRVTRAHEDIDLSFGRQTLRGSSPGSRTRDTRRSAGRLPSSSGTSSRTARSFT
jgi:hypothetical protein